MENFHIKIVRLKNGEDIICFCFEDYKNNKVYLKYPKIFYMGYNYETDPPTEELVLDDWLNPQAFAYQDVFIKSDEVLFVTYSNIQFGCIYLESLLETLDEESELFDGIKETLNKYNEESTESIDSINPKSKTIHWSI